MTTTPNKELAGRVRSTLATVYGIRESWAIQVSHGTWRALDGRTGRWWVANRRIHVRTAR